jgi:hypothetical protein
MTDTSNDPNAMFVEPSVSEDDMEAFLKSLEESNESVPLAQYMDSGESEPTEPPEPPDEEPSEPLEEPDAPGAEAQDYFTINGEQWPRSEIERLYQFDRYLRDNPDAAQRVAEATRPRQTSPAVPEATKEASPAEVEFIPPELPDFLDLDEPSQRFMWESHVATQRAIFDRDQRDNRVFQQLQADRERDVQRQANADMNSALSEFTQTFPNLNEDDITQIRQEAGPLVDGMLRTLPPVQALYRAMEVAAWANADMRLKLENPELKTPSNSQKSTTRKQRLSSISGAPKSAPKTESRPTFTSDRDMVQQFADALAENGLGR